MTNRKFSRGTILLAALAALMLAAGCGGKRVRPADIQGGAEPDRVLFEQAQEDMRRGNHTVARLTLQTLLTTYPDSEFLAKAKLAIADSYFQEGGSANLTQAVAEYKDFIVFFQHLPEASYAQMQIAMTHYQRMEKPDRDRTQARLAEQEFQTFLLKYPDHELTPMARQRLRDVQEVLAEGDFRIANFYNLRGNLLAAAGRLTELVERYPLYSQADKALWMLAQAWERGERPEMATGYYSRIVKDYPLSDRVEAAKERLVALGVPVPQPDPVALARMQSEREEERERPGFVRRTVFGLFVSSPDVSPAARSGEPTLTPPPESGGLPMNPFTAAEQGLTVTVGTPGGAPSNPNVNAPGSQPGSGESSSKPPGAAAEDKKDKKKKEKKDKKKKDEDPEKKPR